MYTKLGTDIGSYCFHESDLIRETILIPKEIDCVTECRLFNGSIVGKEILEMSNVCIWNETKGLTKGLDMLPIVLF